MNTVITDILAWSQEKLPAWQQGILILILSNEVIDEKKIQEIKPLCLEEKDNQQSIPASSHASSTQTAESVSLKEVSGIIGVNTLALDQTVSFSKDGLTIIYGDNGTGKTGYSRIIKSAVRARAVKEAILPDYKVEEEVEQSAKIVYFEGNKEKDFQWSNQSVVSPIELSKISFFDAKCAYQYVEGKNTVAYRPFGLDILDRLVQAIDQVKHQIGHDIQELGASIIQPESFRAETEVGKCVLLMKTDPTIKLEKIQTLATLSQDEETELTTLTEVVKKTNDDEISKEKTRITSYINRLQRFVDDLKKTRTELGAEKISKLFEAKSKIKLTQKALEKVANDAFSTALPNTGGNEWLELWLSAKKYSQLVYPDHTFPVTESDSKCLLCQQTIGDEEVRLRLHNFEDFVKNDLNSTLVDARKSYEHAKAVLDLITIPTENWTLISQEIDNTSIVESVTKFIQHLESYKSLVIDSVHNDLTLNVADHLNVAEKSLTQLISDGRQKLIEYANASKDDDRKKLISRYHELSDRKSLGNRLEDTKKYYYLCQKLIKLTVCFQRISTSAISRKSTELTNQLVTQQLANTFQSEMDKLGVKSVNANLQQIHSEKGNAYFQVDLVNNLNGNASLAKIASEGEYRAVALAGFLTELATADHISSIILDDPVTSLDHGRRKKIAKRLVAESKKRQVIVFTHEITFLFQLLEDAKKEEVTVNSFWLDSRADVTGIVNEGLPWLACSCVSRIGILQERLSKLKQLETSLSGSEYHQTVRSFYNDLRQTWERFVEDTLFKSVVQRFGREVQTKKLRYIQAIKNDDLDCIEKNMDKCSEIVHDPAPGETITIPKVAEIENDFKQLTDLVADFKVRHKLYK